jgi:hypothetical protein
LNERIGGNTSNLSDDTYETEEETESSGDTSLEEAQDNLDALVTKKIEETQSIKSVTTLTHEFGKIMDHDPSFSDLKKAQEILQKMKITPPRNKKEERQQKRIPQIEVILNRYIKKSDPAELNCVENN